MQSNLKHSLPLFRNVLACLGLILSIAPASGQTLVHFYDGGESATGTAGNTLSSITDSAGSTTLNVNGATGTYSATTSGSGGSTLAYSFNGTGGYSAPADLNINDGSSFIMELQFNASVLTGSQTLIYNGNSGTTGIGLYLQDTSLSVLRGSIHMQGIVTVSTGVWNNVALVVNPSYTSVYVNGVSYFLTTDGFNTISNSGTQHLSVGGNGNDGDYYSGFIDNVRISTFDAGTFNTSMLAYAGTSAVPEPSTYAALFGVCALGFAAWKRRRR